MSLTNSTITVRDAGTHFVIPNAQVFINGVGKGVTDTNGLIQIQLVAGSPYTLSIKANNYSPFSAPLNGGDGPTANLQSITAPATVSFTLTIYPEAPANGVPLLFSNGGNPINANYSVGGVVVSGLLPIPQTITGTVIGYDAINDIFDVSAAKQGTVTLTNSTDPGLAQKQQQLVSIDPDISALLPPLNPEQAPEFVAPNTGQGTYFTMTQARMYIGNLFIDELNALQFAMQDNKIPVYGYASRFYDAVAQGKSLVQGQFTVNFISEGYLVTTLREYAKNVDNGSTVIDQIAQQQQARLLTLTNLLQNPDPGWTPDMIAAAKAEISNLASTLGPASVTAAKAGINANIRQQNNSILGLAGGDYPNAVYEDTSFDIVVEYTGAGRTIIRRLEDCHLISNESIMDHSGTPILDSYGFIARRLR